MAGGPDHHLSTGGIQRQTSDWSEISRTCSEICSRSRTMPGLADKAAESRSVSDQAVSWLRVTSCWLLVAGCACPHSSMLGNWDPGDWWDENACVAAMYSEPATRNS